MIEWQVRAESLGACNCDHCCPCQFEGDPTHYACQGHDTFRVLEGHFGDVDLAGVVAANIYAWPGPVYKGGGTMQSFVDENASPEQIDAMDRLLRGQETRAGSNVWWVFHAMCDTVIETRVVPIHLEVDIDARQGRVEIPGILNCVGEPIRNPHDGGAHRVQIRHPEGIEFEYAEIGNANSQVSGAIAMKLENTYAQFNYFHFTQDGAVRSQST